MTIRLLGFLALVGILAACVPSADRAASNGSMDPACGATPDPARPQYIVGYGSLMQDESRRRTTPGAGPAHPVEVTGYRRGWFAHNDAVGFGTTFLGVRPNWRGAFNAVVYQVDAAEVAATDRREASYCREIVPGADVRMLETGFVPAPRAQFWIYVTPRDRVEVASDHHPIVQSYVDIFLSGCMEQEQAHELPGFARQCLATTHDWSEQWVNDRIFPRRPSAYQPKAGQIDRLLAANLKDYFAAIRIEGSR